MEISRVNSTQQSKQLQPAASTQQKSKDQEVRPSTVVTISEEAKKMAEKPPDEKTGKLAFEDDGHHLSNKNYANQAQDPIYQKIL